MLNIKKEIIRDRIKKSINSYYKIQPFININTDTNKAMHLTIKTGLKYESNSLTGISFSEYDINIFTDINDDYNEVFDFVKELIEEINSSNDSNKIIIYDFSYKEYNAEYNNDIFELKEYKNGIIETSEIEVNSLVYNDIEENKKLFKLEIDSFWDSIKIENE